MANEFSDKKAAFAKKRTEYTYLARIEELEEKIVDSQMNEQALVAELDKIKGLLEKHLNT